MLLDICLSLIIRLLFVCLLLFYHYSNNRDYLLSTGFLKRPSITAPTMEPIAKAMIYINGFPTTGNTKIPPWGAISVHLNAIDNAPAVRLTAWICKTYGLSSKNVIRHYDVTGKMCPRYYVKHEQAWKDFCNKVQECLEKDWL